MKMTNKIIFYVYVCAQSIDQHEKMSFSNNSTNKILQKTGLEGEKGQGKARPW